MKSKLFRIGSSDLVEGAISAFFTGAIIALAGVVGVDGFSIFSVEWLTVADSALSAGVATFIGFVVKNFLSDSEGALLGSADIDE